MLLPSGRHVRVPTAEETLRIKAFLVVKRNQVRDYLDVVGLADRAGYGPAARTLAEIDRFYTDPDQGGIPLASQLARQLADPRPRDRRVTERLSSYKALVPRWQSWSAVVAACRRLAARMEEADWS